MKSSFSLIPFDRDNSPLISLTGYIDRQNNKLKIDYKLSRISPIIIPTIAERPIRQFDLWEHTCFELFLGIKNTKKYWEFNLSPAGHWNVFRFSKYRHNIAEEMTFEELPVRVLQCSDELQLNLEIDLDLIITAKQSLEVGITAVVEDTRGNLSYWALTHLKKEADFHDRDSFILDL